MVRAAPRMKLGIRLDFAVRSVVARPVFPSIEFHHGNGAMRAASRPGPVQIARWLHMDSASTLEPPRPSVATSVSEVSRCLAPHAITCFRKISADVGHLALATLGRGRNRSQRGLCVGGTARPTACAPPPRDKRHRSPLGQGRLLPLASDHHRHCLPLHGPGRWPLDNRTAAEFHRRDAVPRRRDRPDGREPGRKRPPVAWKIVLAMREVGLRKRLRG